MATPVSIIQTSTTKDAAGFVSTTDTVLACVRAYMEMRHGNEVWKNRAAFSEATFLFRFRAIPGLTVTTSHAISCSNVRYRILSVEDVRHKGMYLECLADKVESTVR